MKVIRKIIILLFIMFGVLGISNVYAKGLFEKENGQIALKNLKINSKYHIRISRI